MIPIRAITSVSVLAGVVTFGIVLVLGAPPSPAERIRVLNERSARSREIADSVRQALEQGRLSEAEASSDRHIREYPDQPSAWLYYSLTQQRMGDHQAAARGWNRLLDLTQQADNGQARPGRFILHAWALYGQGRRREAARLWNQAAEISIARSGGGDGFYQIAQQMALSGEHDDAARMLHLALDTGFRSLNEFRADPALEPLRDHPLYTSAHDRLLRRAMGPPFGHAETHQIRALPRPPGERLEAWVRRWGDI